MITQAKKVNVLILWLALIGAWTGGATGVILGVLFGYINTLIGIGAGIHCDGQVLVFHDVTGLGAGEYVPKFVRSYAHLADDAVAALEAFFADVESGAFPSDGETYHMTAESAAILEEMSQRSKGILADEAMGDLSSQ